MGRAVLASRKAKKTPDKPVPSAIGGADLSRLATQLVLGGQNCCSRAATKLRTSKHDIMQCLDIPSCPKFRAPSFGVGCQLI